SIAIKDYRSSLNTTCNTHDKAVFQFSDSIYITAPFYDNSANHLEITLINYLEAAKEKIILCAQHLAAFNYNFNATHHSTLEKNETR
ncbi:MAG TPA: hypothetical protein DCM40_20130, partial [Maribacter sp.]|nr:hypothetical protein [Maribacter sp.]